MIENTIITAYFDIDRGQTKIKGMQRSNSKYMDYFRFWARMKNRLIVYTMKEFEQEIMSIRKGYGQENNTEIVVVDNIYALEPDIYERMVSIEKRGQFSRLRLHTKAMSNTAKYNYVVFLKFWCMKDAVEKFSLNDNIAWIDFGYNHGGDRYTNALEFSFYWSPKVSDDKIMLYTRKPIEDVDLFVQLLLQTDSIMGCQMLLNASLADQFYTLIKKACESLLMLNTMDDDQQLLAMAYNWNPDLFEVYMSDWFMTIKENGGEHLSVKYPEKLSTAPFKRFLIQIASDMKHTLENDHGRPIIKDYVWRLKKLFNGYLNK